MTELERIADQVRRAFERDAWHGPAVLETLADVSHHDAAAHPIPGAHSIWELALHLTGTYRLVLRRLGGDGRQMTPEEDWPALPPATEAGWLETVGLLRQLNGQLIDAVRSYPPAKLDEPLVPEAPYTAYTQFIGVTQHDLYHAGQMALLKKALLARAQA